MILTHLELRNFRSYESLSLDFEKGLNLIEGPNGAGKSNLAEAIHYLSIARSWRADEDKTLIKDGAEAAYLKAIVLEGNLKRTIEIEVGRRYKKIAVNGKKIRRLSELSSLVNVIIFSPGDVPLFVGSPGERRKFLDLAISKQSLDYFSLIGKYNRLLGERNALLKDLNPDRGLLDVLTAQMIEVAAPLVRWRHLYVDMLNGVLPGLLSDLRGVESTPQLVYRPFVKDDDSFKERAEKAFQKALDADLRHGNTSLGPQREDLSFLLNGKDIALYGSQGENRIAVLSLKLAPYFLIEGEGRKPICVLDDVFSELDETRTQGLLGFIKKLSQVFVTATKLDTEEASIIDVLDGNATRRK